MRVYFDYTDSEPDREGHEVANLHGAEALAIEALVEAVHDYHWTGPGSLGLTLRDQNGAVLSTLALSITLDRGPGRA